MDALFPSSPGFNTIYILYRQTDYNIELSRTKNIEMYLVETIKIFTKHRTCSKSEV